MMPRVGLVFCDQIHSRRCCSPGLHYTFMHEGRTSSQHWTLQNAIGFPNPLTISQDMCTMMPCSVPLLPREMYCKCISLGKCLYYANIQNLVYGCKNVHWITVANIETPDVSCPTQKFSKMFTMPTESFWHDVWEM